MNFKVAKILHWTPRGICFFLLSFWLVIVFIFGSGNYLMIGIMIWMVLLLTTLTSLKNGFVGGSIFVLLGLGFLVTVVIKSHSLSYILDAAPLLIIGSLFVVDYLCIKKKRKRMERLV